MNNTKKPIFNADAAEEYFSDLLAYYRNVANDIFRRDNDGRNASGQIYSAEYQKFLGMQAAMREVLEYFGKFDLCESDVGLPCDRLRELVEADKDGRLYKFRFGVGSTVYRVWVRPDGTHPFISEDKIECLRDMMKAELWAKSYSTREEAEAALEKLRGANHG